ncbi:MAG: phosphoribosylformylglycinamidine cyclo-ligase [Dehalococcoidia bacterium]
MQDARTLDGPSYAATGVDLDAANRAVERIKRIAASASRSEVLAGVGPFSALFQLGRYRQPVLVSSTDGVGTKVLLARVLDRYGTVGQDLVNHCVNDILTSGAEPLFFLDYLAGSKLSEDTKVMLIEGMAQACREHGCALVGGETADMAGVYADGDFDIAGFIVGVVERDEVIDGSDIRPDDVLLGLPSNGLHTNGYSLVRAIWGIDVHRDPGAARTILATEYSELGETLGDALLRVHPSYFAELRPALSLLAGIAHITGGGLLENVPRILPEGITARFRVETWPRPPLFDLIQRRGRISDPEMYRAFNMGLGLVVVVHPEDLIEVQRRLERSIVVGTIAARAPGTPSVVLQ